MKTINNKKCKDCGNIYPETREFFGQFKNVSISKGVTKIGFRNSCRKCMAKNTKKHYEVNKDLFIKRLEKRKKLENQAEGCYSVQDIEKIRKKIEDKCFFCGKNLFGRGDIEHLTPIARGGTNYPNNLTLSCQNCNKEKTNKTLTEYIAWRKERKLNVRDTTLQYQNNIAIKSSITNQSEITLLKNKQWSEIDGELCRVIDFISMGSIENGKVIASDRTTPYAVIHIECKKLPECKIDGFITHKLDFIHLWEAYKERGVKSNEEVIICWSGKNYKNRLHKIFSFVMPKLWVMICHKGAFELMTNPSSRPDLKGEARAMEELPIIDWKPEVMK